MEEGGQGAAAEEVERAVQQSPVIGHARLAGTTVSRARLFATGAYKAEKWAWARTFSFSLLYVLFRFIPQNLI